MEIHPILQIYKLHVQCSMNKKLKQQIYHLPLLGSVWVCSFRVAKDTDLTMTIFRPGTDRDLETVA